MKTEFTEVGWLQVLSPDVSVYSVVFLRRNFLAFRWSDIVRALTGLDAQWVLADYPSMKRESEMSVRPRDSSRTYTLSIFLIALLPILLASCDRLSAASSPRTAPRATKSLNPMLDSDEDGIPDGAELRTANERESFRRWFTAIAESQFYKVNDDWIPAQRDCAGLVRFALREALRPHDRGWMKAFGEFDAPVAPDPRRTKLSESLLGEKLFRTSYGAFKESDLTDTTFSDFADVRTLKNFNVNFVGRDRKQALPGDLLFFHQPWVQSYPFHVMIFLGQAREANEGASDWVVYHTGGGSANSSQHTYPSTDTIKKVRLAVLDHHPNARWRTVPENVNFLGFYRLKILD
jgi:uncharacterized protein